MPFWGWSKTAASNASSDSTINWSEGMPPSAVNDSARAMAARLAEWRDDISGTITTGGSSTAYTVTSNQVFDTLAHMNGAMICFVPHATNGATVTLNVDGLGAKPLRYGPSLELQTGMLIQGTPYAVTYNNSDAAFYLRSFAANPYGIPLGGIIPYVGSSAPNSAFVLPFGQAVSRTTYATLFALTSTTFGSGDGSTTFNLPDLRNMAIFGLGNMGGSDRGLITNAVCGIPGTTIGAAGGSQSHTLTKAELPVDLGTATTTVTMNDTSNTVVAGAGGAFGLAGGGTHASVTLSATATTTLGGGGGNAHAIMPPGIILPYILRVI